MFRRIVVAYDGSPESQRSLVSAIRLAKSLDAELHTVTVIADLPAYTAFADAADSSVPRMLELDRRQFYQNLHATYSLVTASDSRAILSRENRLRRS
jgi:nucleotide-binding universal stress UspA family protein